MSDIELERFDDESASESLLVSTPADAQRKRKVIAVCVITIVAVLCLGVLAYSEFRTTNDDNTSPYHIISPHYPTHPDFTKWTSATEADSIAWHELPMVNGDVVTMWPALRGAQQGYYRHPVLNGNTLIFVSEGDLWRVSPNGGLAIRLTSHAGAETWPVISPDGMTVAFVAQFEGVAEIYTMPVSGGLPKRLTYEGSSAIPVGWTHRNEVLIRTRAFSYLPDDQLAAVHVETLDVRRIPLSQALNAAFFGSLLEERAEVDPCFVFTRVTQSSHTKRYKGGTAPRLWKFCAADENPEAELFSGSYIGTSETPMWYNNRVYFLSDRDNGIMNIWSLNEAGGDLKQHTHYTCIDVRGGSIDQSTGRISYQHGADIKIHDIASGTDELVEVYLSTDFQQRRERWETSPLSYLTHSDISPTGLRAVFTARGQVFTAPATSVIGDRLVQGGQGRYRESRFISDEVILSLSDETGELEFYALPANGIGYGVKLTNDNGATVSVYDMAVSPFPIGGEMNTYMVAYTDTDFRLIVRPLVLEADSDVNAKENMRVVTDHATFGTMRWSHDGQWLAYTKNEGNNMATIHVYSVEEAQDYQVTSDKYNSFSPAWSTGDEYLYFLTDRAISSHLGSVWGDRQEEAFLLPSTQVYAIAMKPGKQPVPPFTPNSELIYAYAMSGGSFTPHGNASYDGIVPTNAIERTYHVSFIPTGRYSNLEYIAGDQLMVSSIAITDNPLSLSRTILIGTLNRLTLTPFEVPAGFSSFAPSYNGRSILVRYSSKFSVIGISPDPYNQPFAQMPSIDLTKWKFSLDPVREWKQMYIEAWRLMRDYFYDPGMHGVNWEAVRDKYMPLVSRVSAREELDDVISQVVGELSALHVFVYGGQYRELPSADLVPIGFLGATLSKNVECKRCDGTEGECECGWVIEHIHQGSPEFPDKFSPLTAYSPYGAVEEGKVLLAIDGVPLSTVAHPNQLLRNKAGLPTMLYVGSDESGESFPVVVEPITASADADLRYDEWEYERKMKVEEASQGRIGYVHLRAMSTGSWERWVREFYPVFNREGLIVDVRHNRGGNIDSWILEKLSRKAWMYWQGRYGDESKQSNWNMQYAFRGKIVVLCDEHTASDGEAFSEGFKRLGLGTVMGMRTWGGEIWLSSDNRLVDHGIASAPETGVHDIDGNWLLENYGVVPDIEIDNPPHETFNGADRQLDRAVEYILSELERDPLFTPGPVEYPDKSISTCYPSKGRDIGELHDVQ